MTAFSPTKHLVLDVLAARHRTGEPYWTLPRTLKRQLDQLEAAGLVSVLGSTGDGYRVRLTDAGMVEALDLSYGPPVPSLADAINTLPTTNDEYFAWLKAHGLSLSAGPAVYISAIRDDLRKLAGGAR